ncbi:MAG: sensor histidine kinase [Verrucomicrobiia bacterium]
MNGRPQNRNRNRDRWQLVGLPILVIGLTLGILAGTIWYGRSQVLLRIEQQLIDRDGEILLEVAQMRKAEATVFGTVEEPGDQFNLALEIADLEGIMGFRIFAADGKFGEAFPPGMLAGELDPGALKQLEHMEPVSRFHPAVTLTGQFVDKEYEGKIYPILEVNIPLYEISADQQVLHGIAQFIIEGHTIEKEFFALDKNLREQAITAFAVGGSIIALSLIWAFRRIRKYTEDLRQANRELALSARTSALGAVTAHLIHGLKNPLSGLHNFVSTGSADGGGADWESAKAATRRMQTLIADVVAVLREEESGVQYELEIGELLEMVTGKTLTLANELGVTLEIEKLPKGKLNNRNANLVSLVLVNLVQNALQATPRGSGVRICVARTEEEFTFNVSDEGTGLAPHLRATLFSPCSSTKEGGSGLGLAISKQLANHLGARLELVSSNTNGTTFVLAVPLVAFTENTRLLFS